MVGLLLGDALVGGGGDRQEDHRKADADVDARPDEEAEVQVAVQVRQVDHREGDDRRARGDEVLGLDEAGDPADDEHHQAGDDAPRREGEAGPGGGVAEIILQQLRQELRGGDQDRAGRHHHEEAGAELAPAQEPQVHHRVPVVQLPRDHRHEGDRHDGREGDDEVRAEPVLPLPLVEHDLQRAEEGRHQQEADEVEAHALAPQAPPLLHRRGRVLDEEVDQHQGHHADRGVDQEAPVPGIGVGEPAAEGRPDHRRDHDGDPVEREGLAALLRREGIRQDRLRERGHTAAEPLQHPEEQQRFEAPGEAAQHRRDGEERDRRHEERLAPVALGEEARRGQHDRVGDEVARHHPGRLVRPDRESARDVAQRHVGDRGVEHLHEGRERDHHGDDPGIAPAGPLGGAGRAHRTRTVGTMDIPGPIATSSGQRSTTIFTGTRCTTFT
ncbi:hypothetical protein GMJLKIPL_5185 [Methylobacterium isbiliense]|uniref:Uncharacterized protein n=1 Tax=Methylobacterium isbiliense TaxID=315478 RepID=A0ABQ4SND2_9HYPH|nr:hypothetical protein GMJLKIPL_5185 [Methylobacterium isbiliense]